MNEIELAILIYNSAPLNKFRNFKDLRLKVDELTIEQKLNVLIYSFQNYDKGYSKELCLSYPTLWREFNKIDWENLILKMFPRKVKYEAGNLKEINTGSYFDVFLLNGIIGVSPFEFIFQEPRIEDSEKKYFMNCLRFNGEISFYYNERELIEDIVNFYELNTFSDIVNMKEFLIADSFFTPSVSHSKLITLMEKYLKIF